MILKIFKKMKHEYERKWGDHLTDVLGMQELLGDSHGIFTIFPSLWDKSHQPRGDSHPYAKSSARRNPGRHRGTTSERRLMDLEGLEEE